MPNQEDVMRSLDKIFRTLDDHGEINSHLKALNIISEYLLNTRFNEYWKEGEREPSYELSSRVGTQLWMIYEFSEKAKKLLEAHEEKQRSRLEEAYLLLSQDSLEG